MGEGLRRGRVSARRFMVLAPLACVVLAACPPTQDSGFAKVAARSDTEVGRTTMPEPPPVRGDIGGAPAGATQPVVLAALPAGVTQEMVDQGQQLYGTVCVACHGAGGMGAAIGPALNDQNWIHITGEFDELVNIITVGVAQPRQYPAAMPARGGGPFSDDEVRAIAAYVYAISHQGGT
jgi:mono/diheme cytochrome c family protein